jgi:hypothetical protein
MMVVCVGGLAGLSAALFTMALADSRETRGECERIHARYVTQAALAQSMSQLQSGQPGAVGSRSAPFVWGTSRYWVEAEPLPDDLVRLRATGVGDRQGASQELVVRAVPNTIWRYGAFGREFLHMDSNAHVDSYDSRLGGYAGQATNGTGASTHARENGHVGANGHVRIEQNALVWGDASAGPGHVTEVLGNAAVSGSTASSSAEIELPAIVVPTFANYGSVLFGSDDTIPSSDRRYGNLTVGTNTTLTIVGPANIVVTNLRLRSGSDIIVDASAGPVTFYVLDDFQVNSNATIQSTTQDPLDVAINLLSDNVINPEVSVDLDVVDFDSNSKVFGTIYAPSAAIVIESNFELYGSLIARSVDLDSNTHFHFDEALLDATSTGIPIYETVLWRDLPFQGFPTGPGTGGATYPGSGTAQPGETTGGGGGDTGQQQAY